MEKEKSEFTMCLVGDDGVGKTTMLARLFFLVYK